MLKITSDSMNNPAGGHDQQRSTQLAGGDTTQESNPVRKPTLHREPPGQQFSGDERRGAGRSEGVT